MEPEPPQYAVAPDGRIVRYEPHHQTLKAGWRVATQDDIDAKLMSQGAPAPSPLPEPEWDEPVIHESVIELTSE